MRVEMVAAVRRTFALFLMKNNDYVGARKKLIDARTSYPGLEYVDEMIKVCDIVCAAESQGSGIDWRSVLGINKTANESDIEFKYKELMGTLESIKNKFPDIQSALGLIEKTYSLFAGREKCVELDSRGDASLSPCGSAKPLHTAHPETKNTNGGATSGTKRTVGEGSDESNLICNSEEQPLKRVRSLGGDDLRSTASLTPFGSVKPDIANSETVNVNGGATLQSSCGTTRIVGEDSDKSSLICNSGEQPLERVRRLGGGDCEITAESESLDKLVGISGSQEAEVSLGRSSGSPVKTTLVNKEPGLQSNAFSNHGKAGAYAVGQFLAVYDEEKMPRLYAKIVGIESCYKKETNSTDTVLCVRWLRPSPISAGEKKWHEVGFPVSCGFFKLDSIKIDHCKIELGDYPVISHVVSPFQEYHHSDELVEVYPRKGEVWALYKEWKPSAWCLDPKTRKGCKFHLAGYETIFRRSGHSIQVASLCLFAFSHNIPVRSTGDMRGLFSGMVLDLDPFSIPEDVSVDTVAAELTENTSLNNLEMNVSSIEKAGKLAANKDGEEVAEEIDTESVGVSFDGFSANESQCGKFSGVSDDAVHKLEDEEKMAQNIDSKNDGVSLGGFMGNESECENCSSDSDDAVTKLDIGQVMKIINRNRNKESKWEIEGDMLSSLEVDPVLCMKAVCSLHRHQITEGKSVTGSLHNRNRRFSVFSKFVALRGSEMAEFLTDNNPKGDLKKSVKELELFIPGGLEDCKTLAQFYSNELFTIYQSHEDPFFS